MKRIWDIVMHFVSKNLHKNEFGNLKIAIKYDEITQPAKKNILIEQTSSQFL